MPRGPAPQRKPRALAPRPKPSLELLLAKLPHEVRKRDFNRTDDPALIAERGGVRKVERVFEADVSRREHRAHRPGIDPAVGVPPDALVDRAVIHARAASYAAQHRLHVAAEELAPSRVHEDHVKM